MKKLAVIISILFMSVTNVFAADIDLELCEYSEEYISWLNLSEKERQNVPMPNMCKNTDESGLIGSSKSYSMSYFTLQDNYILPVRNQDITDDCWAFSTLAAIESNLLKNSISTDYLSVSHLELMTQNSLYTPSFITFNRPFNGGGKQEYTTAYVLNYWGPIKENDMPFSLLTNILNNNTKITQNDIINKKAIIDVDDIFYLNNPQGACSTDSINTIKQYLVNHGALSASIYFDIKSDKYINNAYYYYNDFNISNHALTIVGWNDNIETNSFKTSSTRKGAWIVKNSYGTNVGDNGYYYVSYDDINICTNIVGFYNTNLDVSDEVYYYDDLGTNVTLTSKSNINYIANIYTKKNKETEKIDKVTFATSKEGINYTVYYASNASLKNYEEIAKGTTSHAGYMSIIPNKDIFITDKYSIIVKYETDSKTSDEIPVAMQSTSKTSPYNSFNITNGVSFISTDGTSWIDLGEKLNIQSSIRVYTSIEKAEETPLIDDEAPINDNATANLTNPNGEYEGVTLGDTALTTDSSETIENPKTGIINGQIIVVILLGVSILIYFRRKNKIYKI